MNTPISLTSELLDADVAIMAAGGNRFVTIFDPRSTEGKRIVMPDFGTVLIGFSSKEELLSEELLPFFAGDTDVLWTAPMEWKLGHIAKRFGMFPSVSQAAKNGFSGDIPSGFSQIQMRANKVRGVLTFFKRG